jgi:hypothetical protein
VGNRYVLNKLCVVHGSVCGLSLGQRRLLVLTAGAGATIMNRAGPPAVTASMVRDVTRLAKRGLVIRAGLFLVRITPIGCKVAAEVARSGRARRR